MGDQVDYFKKCASCKKSIGFSTKYWKCNVSTCNQRKTDFAFCSVECWDSHVPRMNHRESWAIESFSAKSAESAAEKKLDPEKTTSPTDAARSAVPLTSAPEQKKSTIIRRVGGK